jgi:hypothetical protein
MHRTRPGRTGPVGAAAGPDAFARPDAEHSPAAYWFWHQLPTAEQIREQIGQLADGGYLSFQIQARLAYPIEGYLDRDYLDACRIAVAEAARRGMTVGIYDEYNWQSGQAGGRTVHGADQLRERHLFWATARQDGGTPRCTIGDIHSSAEDLGPAGLAWQYDQSRVEWTDWRLVAALAYPSGPVTSAQDIRDVTAAARLVTATDSGCSVEIAVGADLSGLTVTAFAAARSATSRVPNFLMPEAARRFIEVGYLPFWQAFGEHFGKTVKYFFFDQPHATFHDWPQRHGNLRSSLPYDPRLATQFTARTGRSFTRALLALLTDIGPETASLRCDFYQTFSELTLASYLGPIADWCREHGVALSGHEVLGHVGSWHPSRAFSSWDLRVNFGLDYFGLDAYRDITGVDAQDCVPQLSAKMGDSVARSNGRSGCIVEQYMGRGAGEGATWAGHWGLTLEELRAQAIRLHLSGARQFLFHGFYQTDGTGQNCALFTNPRFDFPPGINFEPWWPFHRPFADEAARLSAFLDQAEPACDVAVFYPLRTCWAEGPAHSYGDHLEFWASYLAETGFGYHLVDERDLLRAETGKGKLKIGGREYPCLVLPSVTALRSMDTMAAIGDFAACGGLLVSSGDTPVHLQDGDPAALRAAWAEMIGSSPAAHQIASVPAREQAWQLLAPLLGRHPHARTDPGAQARLWQWAGTDPEAWRLVLFNDGAKPADVSVSAPAEITEWQAWDTATGCRGPWQSDDDASASWPRMTLAPMEVRALRLRPARDRARAGRAAAAGTPAGETPERGSRQVPLAGGWTLRIPGRTDAPVPVDAGRGWEEQGFPDYSGVGIYSCQFEPPAGQAWRLRLPAVRTAVEVKLNGEVLGRQAWAPYEFPLPPELLRPHDNQLEIAVFSAAGNKYYSGTPYQSRPEASGLVAVPVLVGG